jgi:hypothetical protein
MGGGKGSDKASKALEGIAKKSFDIGEPAMQEAMNVLLNALQTGGVESRQPVYSQAVEKSMQASNQAQVAMGEDFARTGTAGTPFAQNILASMMQQGAQQAAMLPVQMENEDYWKILSLFFPGAGQSMGMGIQGMGQAAQIEQMRNQAMMDLFGSLFGGMAGMGASAFAPTPTNTFNLAGG